MDRRLHKEASDKGKESYCLAQDIGFCYIVQTTFHLGLPFLPVSRELSTAFEDRCGSFVPVRSHMVDVDTPDVSHEEAVGSLSYGEFFSFSRSFTK